MGVLLNDRNQVRLEEALASQANWLGIFDVAVHKAPVGY